MPDESPVDVIVHRYFIGDRREVTDEDIAWLSDRRERLRAAAKRRSSAAGLHRTEEAALWEERAYPVLAVLAPVMSSHEGKIEFPGDPMCLYSALCYAVSRIVSTREDAATEVERYNDYCPALGRLPSPEYRRTVSDSGFRVPTDSVLAADLNADQCVFDPRVWNEEVKRYFRERVLRVLKPRVVLVSTVSPGQRYALDIARVVKDELPDCLVVFGGRHVDEVVKYDTRTGTVRLAPSSPLRAGERTGDRATVDFVSSGEGYYATDLLLRAISLSVDPRTGRPSVPGTLTALELLSRTEKKVWGRALIVASLGERGCHAFPIEGESMPLESLPSPYSAFAIRARFPVFTGGSGEVLRTGHVMFTNACPYHCDFCSEGAAVVGRLKRFKRDSVDAAVDRVAEYVGYGAEALFFDDSVLWAGDFAAIRRFSAALARLRESAMDSGEPHVERWLPTEADRSRLRRLQWGGQLTADLLTTLHRPEEVRETLTAMRDAGCTYVYLGIESLAGEVMVHVHKNLRRDAGLVWADKVRAALVCLRDAGLRVGSSVLFGLEGETRATIDQTISGVAALIEDGLLMVASPNILTYHPGTAITRAHGMEEKLDYHSVDVPSRAPYIFFEEAFPGVVSKLLSEGDIWHIHRATKAAWGDRRNQLEMASPDYR